MLLYVSYTTFVVFENIDHKKVVYENISHFLMVYKKFADDLKGVIPICNVKDLYVGICWRFRGEVNVEFTCFRDIYKCSRSVIA